MDSSMVSNKAMPVDAASTFAPLEIGADWQTYTRLNKASFKSETHGGRMVDAYVNSIGLAAFKAGEDLPVGAIVVKTSRDADDGSEGPIFVMEKRAPGFNKEHGDWWYAIHWANPPAAWAKKLGGPVYWRTPSKKADYCSACHDDFVTGIGGVPAEQQTW
ncbi:MAG: cytochrome P460 family protein [Deltaproteobacteria bacterium]|nr:cytochrome P460 family protein [Deltaproteobacteria bacterium]